MDTSKIMELMTSKDALSQVGSLAGISEKDAGKVMEQVLPMLMKGMQGQAESEATQKSFLDALSAHGANDTSDVAGFLQNVDITDGAKIVGHLLGSKEESAAAKAGEKSGIDMKTVMKVMAIAAPLLMSQMGKKAKKDAKKTDNSMAGIVGGLLDGVDANDVINIFGKLF